MGRFSDNPRYCDRAISDVLSLLPSQAAVEKLCLSAGISSYESAIDNLHCLKTQDVGFDAGNRQKQSRGR